MTETNRIEFKRELTRDLDIEREVVAFLNYHEGGVVYIGIDDDGTPVGVKDIDGDMLKIKDRIRMGISPSPMGLLVGSVTDDFGSVNGSVNLSEPTKRQLDIIAIISDYAQKDGSVNGSVKSGATTKEIISKLNVSERTIYRELAVLKQMGLICRVGSDKTGHWEVIKTNGE